ncbi:MAG: Spy0128 family protein [Blautia wexlerae]
MQREQSKNVKGGVTYDKTSYNVVVTITNNIKTGTLTQKVQLAENSPEGQKVTGDNGVYTLSAGENKATFTNRYDATTKYTFTVEKQLAGRKFKDSDNFRFALLKGRTELPDN